MASSSHPKDTRDNQIGCGGRANVNVAAWGAVPIAAARALRLACDGVRWYGLPRSGRLPFLRYTVVSAIHANIVGAVRASHIDCLRTIAGLSVYVRVWDKVPLVSVCDDRARAHRCLCVLHVSLSVPALNA